MSKGVVAVTGAAGFIGSNVIRRLLVDGYDVVAIDQHEPEPVRRAMWDVRDVQRVYCDLSTDGVRLDGVDYVIHLAADMGGVGYFHRHDFWPYLHNARMTMNVLEAAIAAKVTRVFLASSACVYPTELQRVRHLAPKLHEGMLEQGTPDQMYGREKLMALRLAERAPGIDARVGILHTVYGIGQERAGERMKFPTAAATKVLAARRTGTVECWGDGSQLRSYLWIDDAVDRILTVLFADQYDGPVNIGYEGAVSCREVLETCARLVGVTPEITYTADQPTGVRSRDCSNAKWNRVYGATPLVPYEEGFRRLLAWLETTEAAAA